LFPNGKEIYIEKRGMLMSHLKPKPHERVRAAMDLAGYTNYESLANAIGMSISAFTAKINGKRDFTLPECNFIANMLNTTLDAIFFTPKLPKRDKK
jgi:DNA-binding XRE family transcriptional regulator